MPGVRSYLYLWVDLFSGELICGQKRVPTIELCIIYLHWKQFGLPPKGNDERGALSHPTQSVAGMMA